ncbi:MAG TPA: DUF4041 domain-containing protein [Thermoanaerobaculia bacterium]|nr:DUF4041 domain-containing protein [Thermoanaerobaculia bacterium]
MKTDPATRTIPLFGARKMARALLAEVEALKAEREQLREQLAKLGALSVLQLEAKRAGLEREIAEQESRIQRERAEAAEALRVISATLDETRKAIVTTEDLAILQEAGIYQYRHPLSDAVAYQKELANIEERIKAMVRKDGGAVLATTDWTVNGSAAQGRTMVRDFSKLMLRAFNAEADNLVRGLKPYKRDAAIERLTKVASTIERLGKTMQIRISKPYFQLRVRELELTADFLQKEAEEKEAERAERERLREERKVQQEIERERARLEKERQHYANAFAALVAKGDDAGAARIREQLDDVQRAIEDVDYRAANIRAGYVYVISNLGSFGEEMIKVGMTRRLDPMDRIRELSDASVPFNFDIHALFFSKDAVGIETAMHDRLAYRRVNLVNQRREFFRATPLEAKMHLAELAGELLQFQDVPEALEYRESLSRSQRLDR